METYRADGDLVLSAALIGRRKRQSRPVKTVERLTFYNRAPGDLLHKDSRIGPFDRRTSLYRHKLQDVLDANHDFLEAAWLQLIAHLRRLKLSVAPGD